MKEQTMSNVTSERNSISRRYALPVLAVILTIVSPPVGAILGVLALKQAADRHINSSNETLLRTGMILLAGFADVYIAVAVVLTSTGFDPYP